MGSLSVADIQDIHYQYAIHSKDDEIKENFGIVAILDVLGWKKSESLYKKYMGKELVKYQNTADFIDFLEQTFWLE